MRTSDTLSHRLSCHRSAAAEHHPVHVPGYTSSDNPVFVTCRSILSRSSIDCSVSSIESTSASCLVSVVSPSAGSHTGSSLCLSILSPRTSSFTEVMDSSVRGSHSIAARVLRVVVSAFET